MQAVLDTNVVVSALIWGGTPFKLFEMASDGRLSLYTSPVLLAELRAAGVTDESIVRIAREKGALDVDLVDFRRYARDRHGTVDDRPYGGGPGMVLKPEPIFAAVEDLERTRGPMPRVLLTPSGERLRQPLLAELAALPEWMVLCGRYEGFDERIRQGLAWREVSIGDFVLAGGEVPAMVLIEGVARLLPGVLGHEESTVRESFQGPFLDHPHYTRPPVFRGMAVPDVLRSGDHAATERWRREQARRRTLARRPDLLSPGPAKARSEAEQRADDTSPDDEVTDGQEEREDRGRPDPRAGKEKPED